MAFIVRIRPPARGLFLPGGQPKIDWTNPLTVGLTGCWVTTGEGGANPVIRDLVRSVKMVQAGTGQSIVAGPIGMEARDVTNAGWSVTAALSQRPTTAFTALWMGRVTGSPGINNPTLFGGLYNVPLGAPFVTAGIFRSSTTTTTAGVNYNNGTIQQPTFANAFASGSSGNNCLVGSVTLGGTVYLWNNGRLIGSSAAVAGTMSYGGNPTIGSGFQASSAATPNGATTCLGFLWNRQLSSGESALISADPTNFLVFPGDLLAGLLLGKASQALPGQFYDYPNPRAPVPATSLKTWLEPLKLELAGQDAFFGLAGSPQFVWPVPPGSVPSISLKGWTDTYRLALNFVVPPFGQLVWPVPTSAIPAASLRTWIEALNLELAGKDQFFGLAGNITTDWPLPKGYGSGNQFRSWIDVAQASGSSPITVGIAEYLYFARRRLRR